jgi:hypothetical protein
MDVLLFWLAMQIAGYPRLLIACAMVAAVHLAVTLFSLAFVFAAALVGVGP